MTRDILGSLSRYEEMGHLPVCLNDYIKSPCTTYKIIHKLGVGTNAICWLAYNLDPLVAYEPFDASTIDPYNSDCTPYPPHNPLRYEPKRYVALKCISTQNLEKEDASDQEFECHRHLNEHAPGVAPKLFETFEIEDEHNDMTHLCIAMEIVGPTVYNVMEEEDPDVPHLPLGLARRFAFKFVKAVEKMHAVGVAHGDLHANNIVVGRMNCIQDLTIPEIYALMGGNPQPVPLTVFDWRPFFPRNRIAPLPLDKLRHLCGTSEEADIVLIDFGNAWLGDINPRTKRLKNNKIPRKPKLWGPGTPWQISAPEVCLKVALNKGMSLVERTVMKHGREVDIEVHLYPVTAASEMWTVVCTMFFFFAASQALFHLPLDTDGNKRVSTTILCDHVGLLRKMPGRWWAEWWGKGETRPPGEMTYGKTHWTENAEPRTQYALERRTTYLGDRIEKSRIIQSIPPAQREVFPPGDANALEKLLRRCLKWEPVGRATAKELSAMVPGQWKEGREAPMPRKRKARNDNDEDDDNSRPAKRPR